MNFLSKLINKIKSTLSMGTFSLKHKEKKNELLNVTSEESKATLPAKETTPHLEEMDRAVPQYNSNRNELKNHLEETKAENKKGKEGISKKRINKPRANKDESKATLPAKKVAKYESSTCLNLTKKEKEKLEKLKALYPKIPEAILRAQIAVWQSKTFKEGEKTTIPTGRQYAKFLKDIENERNTIIHDAYVEPFTKPLDNSKYADALFQVDKELNSKFKKLAINYILEKFNTIVEQRLIDTKEFYKKELKQAKTDSEKRRLAIILSELDHANIINMLSPEIIFREIYNDIKVYYNRSEEEKEKELRENVNNHIKEHLPKAYNNPIYYKSLAPVFTKLFRDNSESFYKGMLRNMQVLSEAAAVKFSVSEGVQLLINSNTIVDFENDTKEEKTEENDGEEIPEIQQEGWMTHPQTVSAFSKLGSYLKRKLSKIQEVEQNGTPVLDAIRNKVYMADTQVHAVLLRSLENMVSPSDLMPFLEQLANRKPFVKQIIEELKKDPKLLTAFYRAYRKDTHNYVTLKVAKKGNRVQYNTIYTIKENGADTTLEDWADNILNGKVLEADHSIYDKEGKIIPPENNKYTNIEYIHELLTDLQIYITDNSRTNVNIEKFNAYNSERAVKDIQTALKAIGVDIDYTTLKALLAVNEEDIATDLYHKDREKTIKYDKDDNYISDITLLPRIKLLISNIKIILSNVERDNVNKKSSKNTDNNTETDVFSYLQEDNNKDKAYNPVLRNKRFYSNIADLLEITDKTEVEKSSYQGNTTRYAHINPSFVTTLCKKLTRRDIYKKELEKYRKCSFFYNKETGKWRNHWLQLLEDKFEARKQFTHADVIEFMDKAYKEWTPIETLAAVMNMYGPVRDTSKIFAYSFYNLPMLSDKPSAEFLRAIRYTGDVPTALTFEETKKPIKIEMYNEYYTESYEGIISNLMIELVEQEIDRIQSLEQRNEAMVNPIMYYDITTSVDKDGNEVIHKNGAEFKFFPELNNKKVLVNGKSVNFTDRLDEMTLNPDISSEERREFIRQTILEIMNDRYTNFIKSCEEMGLFDPTINKNGLCNLELFEGIKINRTKPLTSNELKEKFEYFAREFYWNSTYAQSQMIPILTSDAAFYPNVDMFQKRASQFHSYTEKLNTLAEWNGERVLGVDNEGNPNKEKEVTLADEEITIPNFEAIKALFENKVKKGEMSEEGKNIILGIYNHNIGDGVSVTDGQAYRSLKSFRKIQIMANEWSDEAETAYNNIRSGKFEAQDFIVLFSTKKPFLYTLKSQNDGISKDNNILVPVNNKNSEMVLLTAAIFGEILGNDSKLGAIAKFMDKHDIDLVQFESAVKVGSQGAINLNDIDPENIVEHLENITQVNSDTPDITVLHENDYDDYGIQTATPVHGEDSKGLFSVQLRRLVNSDRAVDAKFDLEDRKLSNKEWDLLYNSSILANLKKSFEEVERFFNSKKELETELLRIIKNNPSYGTDIIKAITLDENGEFNLPLLDPTQTLVLQTLLTSKIRNKITKQSMSGAGLIMASPYGMDRPPKIVYNKNGSIKHIEAYVACPSQELADLLYDEKTHSLDINKKHPDGEYICPLKYRESIGVRIPTEDKYSMLPIKFIGFLSPQYKNVIIAPAELTAITGCDYDVDKVYLLYHDLNFSDKYNIKDAWDDFYKLNPEVVQTVSEQQNLKFQEHVAEQIKLFEEAGIELDEEDINNEEEFIKFTSGHKNYEWDPTIKDKFNAWFEQNKDKYFIYKEAKVVKFNHNKTTSKEENKKLTKEQTKKYDLTDKTKVLDTALANSTKQRNSLLIDLMFSALTNVDTLEKQINPGNFESLKKYSKIVTILDNISQEEYAKEFGSNIENLYNKSLRELSDIEAKYAKPLLYTDPTTYVILHDRNMAGINSISFAVLNSKEHAVMQRTKLGIANRYAPTINGIKYDSLHDIKNKKGEYISRNVTEYLTAFVDNGKYAVAGILGINNLTADVAFALVRSGVPQLTVGLLLNQPLFKEAVKIALLRNIRLKDAINIIETKYRKTLSEEDQKATKSAAGIAKINFTDEELANNIVNDKTTILSQVKVNQMLQNYLKVSNALAALTLVMRVDSQSGGVGPYISTNVNTVERIREFYEDIVKKDYPLTNVDSLQENYSDTDILESNIALVQAFYTYGIEKPNKLLNKHFNYFSKSYTEAVNAIKELSTYGRIDNKLINQIYFEIINYNLSLNNTLEGVNKQDVREYYINEFPIEFKDYIDNKGKKDENKSNIGELDFIKRLRFEFDNRYTNTHPFIYLKHSEKVTDEQKIDYINDWNTMFYSQKAEDRIMAKKLFIYSAIRGFGFSPNGFGKYAPTDVKMAIPEYIQALNKYSFNVPNFVGYFMRNNLDNTLLVPVISSELLDIDKETSPTTIHVKVTNRSNPALNSIITSGSTMRNPEYRRFIKVPFKVIDLYYELKGFNDRGEAVYHLTTPLGSRYKYTEYDANMPYDIVESVNKDNTLNGGLNSFIRAIKYESLVNQPTPRFVEETDNTNPCKY